MARTPEPAAAGSADVAQILGQGRTWWQERPPGFRRNLVIIGLLVAAAVGAVTLLTGRNPMTPIYTNLSGPDIAQVSEALGAARIPYTLSGTSILVPKADANQARVDLAMQGLPKKGIVGYTNVLKTASIGMTPAAFNLAVLNALQNDLATTINSISGVKSSNVIIHNATPSVFVNQSSTAATAAVFLNLDPGVQLSSRQVLGIEELVAHSVQGLSLDHISVTNQEGSLLVASQPGSASTATGAQSSSGAMSFTTTFEKSLDSELTTLLEPMAGAGNVVVQTSAQLDLSHSQTQSTTFQPLKSGSGVPVSQSTIKETYSGAGTPPAVAGSQSNSVPTYPATSATGGNSNMNYTDQTINYDVTKVNQTVTSAPYTVKGITVSVMLNSRAYTLTSTNKAALTNLIASAVGYPNTGQAQNDITIVSAPFAVANAPAAKPSAPKTSLPSPPILGGAALALVVLILAAFMLLRRNRQAPVPAPLMPPPEPQLVREPPSPRRQMEAQVVEEAKSRPEDMAQVVRTWLHEDQQDRGRTPS